jgi:methionyl-tRNA formyltransferase
MHSLIFFGSDKYSALVLKHLLESQKVTIAVVVTDQAKPKDRGLVTEPFPVEKLAIEHSLKVLYYPSNNEEMNTFIDTLKSTIRVEINLGLCASFDHLVPSEITNLFNGHLYNLHPSLLPQYRNVSPVQYALALGDAQTGITLFRITTDIDNGEILGQTISKIEETDTTPTLSNKLFPLGAELVIGLIENDLRPLPFPTATQAKELVFTKRLTRDSGHIEWPVLLKLIKGDSVEPSETQNPLLHLALKHTSSLDNVLRALTPWPTIWTMAQTKKGELRLTLESVKPQVMVKLAGKPKAISWSDFTQYYL